MVSFGHTAAGTITGVLVYQYLGSGNLATGLIGAGSVGLVTHYLGDLMPHGHFFKNSEFKNKILLALIFDVIIPVIFILVTAFYVHVPYSGILYIIFGIGGAQLPDILASLVKLEFIKKNTILSAEMKFHSSLHWHGKGEKSLMFSFGDIWQILLFTLAVLVLIKS